MSKVLIFTHFDKLGYMNPKIAGIMEDIYPYEDEPISLLTSDDNGSSGFKYVKDFLADGIYLVYDQLSNDAFDAILHQCNEDGVYTLYHSLPKRSNELFKLKKGTNREGRHELGNAYYPPIFEVLTDPHGDKQGRIIRILELTPKECMANAIHVFMNGCWTHTVDTTEFLSAYHYLLSFDEIKREVKDYFENKYPDTAAFISIRDLLTSFKKKMLNRG